MTLAPPFFSHVLISFRCWELTSPPTTNASQWPARTRVWWETCACLLCVGVKSEEAGETEEGSLRETEDERVSHAEKVREMREEWGRRLFYFILRGPVAN